MTEVIHDTATGYKVPVILEDGPLLVVNKPAGLIAQGAPAGQPSAVDLVKEYLKRKYNKPGNVWLGVCHRLDRPVSGLVVFARNSKAAGRLSEQFRERKVTKLYLAVVEQGPQQDTGELQDWLRQSPTDDRSQRVAANTPGARHSTLKFTVLARQQNHCILVIDLGTGRKHQIRAQLACRGWPIVGDTKYGGRLWKTSGRKSAGERQIALHAARLTLQHPIRRDDVTVTAPVPDVWSTAGFACNVAELLP